MRLNVLCIAIWLLARLCHFVFFMACFAPLEILGISLFRKVFLRSGGENEFLPAVITDEDFVCKLVSHDHPSVAFLL